MEDAKGYLKNTAPAAEGLFKLLKQYGWHRMRAFVDTTNAKTRSKLEKAKSDYSSVDIARDVIAGSILQIAYFAIKRYAPHLEKTESVLEFERKINEIVAAKPSARCKHFSLPQTFCVGRSLGHLPIGLIIYAARNQYNHFEERRLSVVNEVVFNYLKQLWPEPVKNGISFNLYNNKHFYSYAVLCALGWVDSQAGSGYKAYLHDMKNMLEVAF